MGFNAKAPYSGSEFDLIQGCWIKETVGVHIDKETAARKKATGVYAQLVEAGKLLMAVIRRNECGANKYLARVTAQIHARGNAWDR